MPSGSGRGPAKRSAGGDGRGRPAHPEGGSGHPSGNSLASIQWMTRRPVRVIQPGLSSDGCTGSARKRLLQSIGPAAKKTRWPSFGRWSVVGHFEGTLGVQGGAQAVHAHRSSYSEITSPVIPTSALSDGPIRGVNLPSGSGTPVP